MGIDRRDGGGQGLRRAGRVLSAARPLRQCRQRLRVDSAGQRRGATGQAGADGLSRGSDAARRYSGNGSARHEGSAAQTRAGGEGTEGRRRRACARGRRYGALRRDSQRREAGLACVGRGLTVRPRGPARAIPRSRTPCADDRGGCAGSPRASPQRRHWRLPPRAAPGARGRGRLAWLGGRSWGRPRSDALPVYPTNFVLQMFLSPSTTSATTLGSKRGRRMVQRVTTVAFEGIEARAVDVQVQVAPGQPAFNMLSSINFTARLFLFDNKFNGISNALRKWPPPSILVRPHVDAGAT